MEINCVAHVRMQKGLHRHESRLKSVFVGLDDLPDDLSDSEIKELVKREAGYQLTRTEDYRLYGKNWEVTDVEHC